MIALAIVAASAATAVGVGLDEYTVASYCPSVRAGLVRFNAHNRGEDAHDLALRSPGGRTLASTPEIAAGASGTLSVRVRTPGLYTLVCTLSGHEALGMRASIRVRAAPRHGRSR